MRRLLAAARRSGMYRRLALPLRCASLLGAACLLLVLAMPAWGATGAWDRVWGKDVVSANAETGFEVCTVAALCQAADLPPDGIPVGGELYRPTDVAVAPNGDVYVASPFPLRSIMVFDASGQLQRIFGSVSDPSSIAIDGAGNVYVASGGAARIVKFDSAGNFLRTWGKNVDSVAPGTGAEICTVAANCKSGEQGGRGGEFGADPVVAVSPSGTVYVAERARDRVQAFDGSGNFIRAWGNDVVEGNAETGPEQCTVASQCQFGGHGSTGGEFSGLWGVAVDAAGNVYTAESGSDGGGSNARIQKFSPTGAFVFALGKDVDGSNLGTGFEVCTNAPACLGGTAATTAGAFRSLTDVAVDRDGNLYTAEADNHRVQKFAPSGAFVSTWGKGVSGGAGFEICTTVDGCQGGDIGGKGGEVSFDLFGIGVNAVNSRVLYTAETADGGRVQVFGARVPTLTAISPPGPANDNQPKLIGSAQEGATVTIYATANCTGPVRGSGAAATLASPGLPVTVGDDSTTTFYATATAGGETSDCSRAGVTYVEDSTPPPTPTISGTSPASPSDDQSPKVFGSAEAGSTVRLYTGAGCGGTAVASGPAASFASPGLTVSVAHGSSTIFHASATDAAGNVSGCSPGVIYEATLDTAITSGPAGPTNVPAPAFGFTANPAAGATFVCSVDHASPSACSSPSTTGHLSDGSHEFEVAAVAPGGTQDPTPATRTFFVDTVAPVTSPQILGGQQVGQSSTFHGSVLLSAPAADPAPSPGGVQTRCEYTSAGTPPPASFDALADGCSPAIVSQPGDYAFYAASRDAAGNVEAAVQSVRFTILPGVDVSITSGPSGATWLKQPLFGFTSSTAGATYRCHIDGDPFVTCQSPWLATERNPGDHAFYVKAVAPDGTESTVEARYYTIQAPTTAANEPHGHCAVNPFLVDSDNPNGGKIIGCGFGTCPRRIACSPAMPPCPTGALCTLRFTSHFANDDPAIRFDLVYYCQQHPGECKNTDELNDQWRVTHHFDSVRESGCLAQVLVDPRACDASSTETIVGQNRTISPTCSAQIEDTLANPLKPGDLLARDIGPDSSRHLACDATESIAPASALDLASVKPGPFTSYLYVPATGTLTLTPGAGLPRSARVAASAARKRPAPPGIASAKITVRQPGAVALRFHLNQAATQLLARRHKLKLRVKITLQPPHQAAITRTHTVTFAQPTKPPNARQRRQAARRQCLRKHRHQARICSRL